VVFRRFFATDWTKGALIVSSTDDRILPVSNPLWLTRLLLLNDASRAGFLRWLFSVTDTRETFPTGVAIPHFGQWMFSEGPGVVICSNGKQKVEVESLYQGNRRRKGHLQSLGEVQGETRQEASMVRLDEQVPLLLTQGHPGRQTIAFKSERGATWWLLARWLLSDTPRVEHEAELTPSQRAAFSPYVPPEGHTDRRGEQLKDLKRSIWAEPVMRINMQFGGPITIAGLTPINPYHRKEWEVTPTTLEGYQYKTDHFHQRTSVRLERAREYPLGLLFSSTSLLSLVWAEIHWCALNDVKASFCQHCGGLFTLRSHATFCSLKCWEHHDDIEEGGRKTLKHLHQRLTRLAKQANEVTNVKAWISGYLREWKRYEVGERRTRRLSKSVHPAIVALKTPEGSGQIDRIRGAKRMRSESDYWLKQTTQEREALNQWLKALGVPMPHEAWIGELLKP
jgi:hypothetical protein